MKYAVVLGGSSGVGKAIAATLTTNYPVIAFHRGRSLGSKPGDIHKKVGGLTLVTHDVGSTSEAVEIGINEVKRLTHLPYDMSNPEWTPKPVDVLVHSLSGASIGSAIEMNAQKVERTFNSLAHSFLWWVQGLRKRNLLNPGAKIIALSNPCPDFYLRNTGVIGAAKAALEAYVRILAAELGPEGYRVNCVRFSTVLTPALKTVLPAKAIERLTELHKHIVPAGRMQTAEDVARFVSLLVRDEASWMNGAVIDFTGGAPMMLMDYTFNGGR